MDPLSQIIGLLKPQAVFWRVIEAHDAWTIGFRPTNVVVFGQVIEGACHVEREDGISFDLDGRRLPADGRAAEMDDGRFRWRHPRRLQSCYRRSWLTSLACADGSSHAVHGWKFWV